MPKKALVLYHARLEKAEMFETILSEKGWNVEHVYAPKEDISALDALEPDLVLIMGGAMGVYEQEEHPYLMHEITFIKKRLAQDLPMLGICLGSQLIAAALGEKVYKGDKGKEIGWTEIQVNEAGKNHAIRHVDGSATLTFHWHGDTYQVPDNATLLASTPAYKSQAYALGKTLAFQFHPEVTGSQLEEWFEEEIDELKESILCADIKKMRELNNKNVKILNRQVRLMMDEWLQSVGLV